MVPVSAIHSIIAAVKEIAKTNIPPMLVDLVVDLFILKLIKYYKGIIYYLKVHIFLVQRSLLNYSLRLCFFKIFSSVFAVRPHLNV